MKLNKASNITEFVLRLTIISLNFCVKIIASPYAKINTKRRERISQCSYYTLLATEMSVAVNMTVKIILFTQILLVLLSLGRPEASDELSKLSLFIIIHLYAVPADVVLWLLYTRFLLTHFGFMFCFIYSPISIENPEQAIKTMFPSISLMLS